MPLAVFAMLTVGAFTINASEKTDNAVNTESVTDLKADDPYDGDHYIRTPDPSGPGFIFIKVDEVVEGECTFVETSIRCTITIGTEVHGLWGEASPGVYAPLYEL